MNAVYFHGLIGPFDLSSYGHHFAWTVMCMLVGYTFCITLKSKLAFEVVQAYIDEIHAKSEWVLKDSIQKWN